MHSIRTRITAVAVSAIIIVMAVAMAFGVIAIRNIGRRNADQLLYLLCETGEKNLDHYFQSVEQSVEMVSAYVESDLDGLDDARLQAHLDRVSAFFKRLSYITNGVLTYYYRIDPAVSRKVQGFWYVDTGGDGFHEHEVTDITLYDTEDTSSLVWFTVPKATGKGVWLPPYITDNLDVRVISYNVPVYLKGRFVGVIGIEIDYSTMAEAVNHITLYENGYAFLNDAEGRIVYHPHMDISAMKTQPTVPDGLLSDAQFVRYRFDGVEKQAVCLPLSNGMRLNVTVPVKEINAGWQRWSNEIIIVFAALLVVFVAVMMNFVGRITRPLRELTAVAEQVDAGNYNCALNYDGKDEIGILTRTFSRLTVNLKAYISDLNDLAYADALTSLHNKGAFDICMLNMQAKLDEAGEPPEFAVCLFDCNSLKRINDENGHDKGDIYLKGAAALICEVFNHSPVYRIGGDEFAALLQGGDYSNRNALLSLFDEKCADRRIQRTDPWERLSVARGMAVYDPREDESAYDVVRRADKAMYENKWRTKNTQPGMTES